MVTKSVRSFVARVGVRTTFALALAAFLLAGFSFAESGSAAPLAWNYTTLTVQNRIGIGTETPDTATVIDARRSDTTDTYIKSRHLTKGAYFQTQSGINWAGYNMLNAAGATATYFGYRGSTEFRVYDALAAQDRILMEPAGTANGEIYLNPASTGKVAIGEAFPNGGLEIDNEYDGFTVNPELFLDEDDTTGKHVAIVLQYGAAKNYAVGVNASSGIFFIWNQDLVSDSLRVNPDGTVEIGYLGAATTSHLCKDAYGAITSCSSAAEYVPTGNAGDGFPEEAELVSILPGKANPYGDDRANFLAVRSSEACDSNLIGFILDPALGADGEKVNDYYLPLVVYGYFPVKVNMEGGEIHRGDGITSSSTPGVGMKANDACRIVGYALDDLDHDGTVMVYAHLTDYIPKALLQGLNDLLNPEPVEAPEAAGAGGGGQ